MYFLIAGREEPPLSFKVAIAARTMTAHVGCVLAAAFLALLFLGDLFGDFLGDELIVTFNVGTTSMNQCKKVTSNLFYISHGIVNRILELSTRDWLITLHRMTNERIPAVSLVESCDDPVFIMGRR